MHLFRKWKEAQMCQKYMYLVVQKISESATIMLKETLIRHNKNITTNLVDRKSDKVF
jgi:hypothetical protein